MEVIESERGMSVDQSGIERGFQMVRFLEKELGDLDTKTVLDIGCGLGGITIALASRCKFVVSMDYDIAKRLSVCKRRLRERGVTNVLPVCGNCLQFPFSHERFDLIILNGVMEWLGISDMTRNPRAIQQEVLQSVRALLKSDGVLYLAIENRYYPANLIVDPHAKLPIVDYLPRKCADIFSYLITSKPYRTYIYSFWGLSRILSKASFRKRSFYVPLTNYMFPYEIVNIEDRKQLVQAIYRFRSGRFSAEYRTAIKGRTGRVKFFYFYLIAWLGLCKLLTHSFVVLCRKSH